jgi:hypothetical protein
VSILPSRFPSPTLRFMVRGMGGSALRSPRQFWTLQADTTYCRLALLARSLHIAVQ